MTIETIHILRLDFLNSSQFMEFSQTSFDNIMVFLGVSPVLVSNPILLTFSTHLENPQFALPPKSFQTLRFSLQSQFLLIPQNSGEWKKLCQNLYLVGRKNMDMYMVMNTTRQNPEELMQNLTQAHKKSDNLSY